MSTNKMIFSTDNTPNHYDVDFIFDFQVLIIFLDYTMPMDIIY